MSVYYSYLIEKVTSTDVRITNISQSLPQRNKSGQLLDRTYSANIINTYNRLLSLFSGC